MNGQERQELLNIERSVEGGGSQEDSSGIHRSIGELQLHGEKSLSVSGRKRRAQMFVVEGEGKEATVEGEREDGEGFIVDAAEGMEEGRPKSGEFVADEIETVAVAESNKRRRPLSG